MTGTGLILINPPYQLDSQLKNLCDYLSHALPVPAPVQGHEEPKLYPATYSVQWLTGEKSPKDKAADTADPASATTVSRSGA